MYKYVDSYKSNIERLGNLQMFFELDLITFEFNGHEIRNPIVDETDCSEVLPCEYYGKDFLNSDFMDSKKVKNVIEFIQDSIKRNVREFCLTNEYSFIYDLTINKYVIKGKTFITEYNCIENITVDFKGLYDEVRDFINVRKKYEGGIK